MNLKKGDIKYFNNAEVEILRVDHDQFVLVCGHQRGETNINGGDFCMPCNVGNYGNQPRHSCSDAQEIIDFVLEDLSDRTIFWVDVKYLQEKPIERGVWEKLTTENKQLEQKRDELRDEIALLEVCKSKHEKDSLEFGSDIEKLQLEVTELRAEIEELATKKKNVICDNEKVININNSKFNISVKGLLSILEDSIKLRYLENGGVDNWEWYGEALPDDDEAISNEALSRLLRFIKP